MRLPVDRLAAWVPAVLFVATVAVASHSFVVDNPSTGAVAVDVQVVSESAEPVAGGTVLSGGLDIATVDGSEFSFAGWADFPRGASLVLATRSVVPPTGSRIRLRSLPRPDVVTALHDPALLYSGFSFGGTAADWGAPRCLYLRFAKATRVIWSAKGGSNCS
jgi:hypothetical protein